MTEPKRWSRLQELYHAALSRPAREREAFLAEACGPDAELVREVKTLLGFADEARQLLERPVPEAATEQLALPSGTRLGPYEVLGPIGSGGMGEVYRARDNRLGRDVAVKVLPADAADDPHRLKLFEREARAVAALNHPNIVTVHDVGRHDGTSYVVTELLEGETLRELVSQRTPTAPQILAYALQAAHGLAAAHAKGIVHRDLKPENLFLTADGRVKVLDFGLARLARVVDATETPSATDPARVVGTAAYMSPEQARGQRVDARSDVFSFGIVLHELLARQHPFRRETLTATLTAIAEETPPGLEGLGRGVPPAVGAIVRRCLEKTREDRYASGREVAVALEAVLRAPSDAVSLADVGERSPYPGLHPFTEKDAAVFFGREREVADLWEKLQRAPLLAVIGPSGAGKSSFVRAGVVAQRPQGWAALVCTPGPAPMRSLARALAPELAGDSEALRGLPDFEDPRVALSLIRRWREGHGEALVVVDQFEELFTQSPETVQESFSALLGHLASEADVHVLLSVRDDFLIRCHAHPSLAAVFRDLTPLLPLAGGELRRALEEPAKKHGYRFEDEVLVDEMLADVAEERGALPLLAFAAARLWDERDPETSTLTRRAYDGTGGVGGALAQHAEATLDAIGPENAPLVRELFRNLVTPEGTRATREREELLSLFEDRGAAEPVLEALLRARLLTAFELPASAKEEGAPQQSVEIIHESLLSYWPRLVRWRTQDADGAQLREQLRRAAQLWRERGESDDLLWSGQAYRDYALWRERYPVPLTATEAAFARATEASAARRRRRRRALVAALVGAAAGIAIVTAALWQRSETARRRASEQALRAEASRLLALAQLRLEADPTEALAWATASLELSDTPEARLLALRILAEGPPGFELEGGNQVASFSPDGRLLATSGQSAEVRVWGAEGGPALVLSGHRRSPNSPVTAFWASNDLLVTRDGGGSEARGHAWTIPAGKRVRSIDVGAEDWRWWHVSRATLLARTRERAAGREFFRFRSWRLPDGEPRELGRIDASGLGSGEFVPDGTGWVHARGRELYLRALPIDGSASGRLLGRHASDVAFVWPLCDRPPQLFSAARDGEIRVWDFSSDEPRLARTIPPNGGEPRLRRPDPTARWAADVPGGRSAGESWLARVWDLRSWPEARPLTLRRRGLDSPVPAFHPRGEWIVVGAHLRLGFWPLRGSRPRVVQQQSMGLHRPLAFSPDGQWLATVGSAGDELRLWPLPGEGTRQAKTLTLPGARGVTRLVFDPIGRFLFAVASRDRSYVIPLDGSGPRRLEGFSEETLLKGAAVSPSGRRVATAFLYGTGSRTLRVWDLETGERQTFELPDSTSAEALPQTGRQVMDVAFADESTLYTAGDGGVRRWDLASGAHELVFATEPGNRVSMTLAADRSTASVRESAVGLARACGPVKILDLATGEARPLPAFGVECTGTWLHALDASGTVLVSGDDEGTVRIGRVSGGEPHLLLGHDGPLVSLAISPDLHWLATTGRDDTLRLWPVPDLSKAAPHMLPHAELVARLRSLTNVRVVRDPDSPQGWRLALDPFPGWATAPEW